MLQSHLLEKFMPKSFLLAAASMLALVACSDDGSSGNDDSSGTTVDQMGTSGSDTSSMASGASASGGQSGAMGSEVQGAMEETAGTAAGMSGAGTTTAEVYVANAAMGDMYEIESSRLALEQSQSSEVREFAQQMINDHTATTTRIKSIVTDANLGLTPPTQLDSRRAGMLNQLKNVSATEFDTAYLNQQTTAHREALQLHTSFAEGGDNEQLRAFAEETAPKIQRHLDMVENMDGRDE